ncbi:hypothetical protein BO70DRAFT_412118 [Aspergillus heteromorphus CBS 117.55]|uniref:Uncharacterized protein n=1 Tax=Aspergillus heteromorphus CBS 117.55 TaxID=1448321 RepID=A0A317VN74_9EURO|nr:uncharacterized protein BO70DRAFT_412118 [Aspergillus heteromorphus CBS 117.55]PWY75029.1 hypothetical protein BO70DRAFT_412118 [Aspergillus heteromorphus CBS 117.55]
MDLLTCGTVGGITQTPDHYYGTTRVSRSPMPITSRRGGVGPDLPSPYHIPDQQPSICCTPTSNDPLQDRDSPHLPRLIAISNDQAYPGHLLDPTRDISQENIEGDFQPPRHKTIHAHQVKYVLPLDLYPPCKSSHGRTAKPPPKIIVPASHFSRLSCMDPTNEASLALAQTPVLIGKLWTVVTGFQSSRPLLISRWRDMPEEDEALDCLSSGLQGSE